MARKYSAPVASSYSSPNYPDVRPDVITGGTGNEWGRNVLVATNVPAATAGKTHQKYDAPPFPGGDFQQFNAAPYQRQPVPNDQWQYGTPRPGIDLTPPDANYPNVGEGYPHIAPFAWNNLPKNIAPRPSEAILQNKRIPLSFALSAKRAVEYTPSMQFNQAIVGSGLGPFATARDYPRKYNGWVHREYFSGPGAIAQREREAVRMGAPPQLQVSPGGLVIQSYQNVLKNVNSNLVSTVKGAVAPVANTYSGMCK